MLRAYVAQQRQLLHMARKNTLPQTDCRQISPFGLLASLRIVEITIVIKLQPRRDMIVELLAQRAQTRGARDVALH